MEMCLRSAFLWFGFLSLIALTASCTPLPAGGGTGDDSVPADGTGDGGDGDDGGGDSLTGPLASTVAVADEASDEFIRLYNEGSWPDGREDFMDYARSLDGVAQVNLHEATGDVTLVYDSGVFHIFHVPDNAEEELAEPEGTRARARTATPIPKHDVLPAKIPSTPRATMATSHDTWSYGYEEVSHALEVVRSACDHAGYEVPDTPPDASVEWFRTWDNYGVIFFQGHGNFGTFRTVTGDEVELYALQTSNRYFGAAKPDSTFNDDLTHNRLGFTTIPTSGGRDMRVLVVTRLLFEHYCNPMQPGAVVYINSCRTLVNREDLPQTLTDLGSEMVLGWNSRSPVRHSAEMAEVFFDLACGLNEVSPTDPPRRPFTVDDVYEYFVDNELTMPEWISRQTGEHRVGSFEFHRADADEIATSIRPVISEGWFVPGGDLSLLHLRGYFGDEEGQILVDDTEIEILTWSEDRVIGMPPMDLAGDVVVRVGELDSNPLRLSLYSGSLSLDVQDPRGRWEGTVDVDFSGRGIVQRIRDEIDAAPRGLAVPPVTVTRMWLQERFDMTWDIWGDWEETCGSLSPETEYHNLTATGRMDDGDLGSGIGMSSFGLTVDINLDAGAAPDSPAVTYGIEYFVQVDGTHSWWGCYSDEAGWSDVFSAGPLPMAPAGDDAVIPRGSHAGEGYVITWDEIAPDLRPPWGSGDEVRPAAAH